MLPAVLISGLHLDELTGRYRTGEPHVAHVRRHAVAAAPADGAGVPGLVDPLQQLAAVHGAAVGDVHRRGEEPQDDVRVLGGGRGHERSEPE